MTSGAIIGALGIWQGLGHFVRPGVYWTVALVGFLAASYRVWLDRSKELDAQKAEFAKLQGTPTRDWAGEWKELADRFKPHSGSGIRADWQHSSLSSTEMWNISGTTHQGDRSFRALCKLAGTLLATSPGICGELSDLVQAQKDEINRWLYFLKETQGLSQSGYGHEITSNEEQFLLVYGSIADLGGASATACIECAAKAFANS